MKLKMFLITLVVTALLLPAGIASALLPIIDLAPILTEVTPVPTPTIDTTPSYTFNTTEGGMISYDGDCSSTAWLAGTGDNTITFNALPVGTYTNCRIMVTDVDGDPDDSAWLDVSDFEITTLILDFTDPVLTEVTPVPDPTLDTTPNYTFHTSEAGTISYSGDCSSSDTTATAGNNTVTFNTLSYATHSNCKITVTDAANNESDELDVSEFTVSKLYLPSPDTTAPTLSMVKSISTPTTDNTPSFTFASDEEGDVTYSGDCTSSFDNAEVGNNYVTFSYLAEDTYTNCKLRVEDAAGNDSAWLNIPTFVIVEGADPDPDPVDPSDYCAGFSDVSESDSACDAIEFVKKEGIMTGNPNGTFGPDDYLQRDQIAKVALLTHDEFSSAKNYCSGNPFPDVRSTDWSYQYVCRGVALGMITGYASGVDTGYYRPARSVNRAEFLALILRNLPETMPSINSSSYSDVEPGQWYSGYAKYAYDNSLLPGSKLYPTNFVKREEVAKAIYQLDKLNKI